MYINTFKYTPKDVSCQLCTEYVKKLGCTALRCPWLAERIEAGVVGYREAVLETFPHERRLFQRLNLLIKHYPGSLWSCEQHERRMQYQCAVQGYEAFMEALRRVSPVPIEVKPLRDDLDGFFSPSKQSITLRAGMSEVQTVCTAVHEIAHSKLHDYAKQPDSQPKDSSTEEIEAESIAYTVCAYFGIETSANSFGYVATWSKDKDLKAFKESLDTLIFED